MRPALDKIAMRTPFPYHGERMSKTFRLAFCLSLSALAGCTSSPSPRMPEQLFFADVPSHAPSGVKLLWKQAVPGAISDLAFANQAQMAVIAVAPDPDIPGSTGQPLLMAVNSRGKTLWRMKPKAPLRALSVSAAGDRIVAGSYFDQVLGFDIRGRQVWSLDGMCRPIILNRWKRVLCYHDDDAEPFVAFDWISWDGEKDFSYPIKKDILSLKVADDEQHFAIGLTSGQLIVFEITQSAGGVPQIKELWKTESDGEIVDLDVTAGPDFKVLSLHDLSKNKQSLKAWDSAGKVVFDTPVEPRMSQVEAAGTRSLVAVYGNSKQGQHLNVWDFIKKERVWGRGAVQGADFTSTLQSWSEAWVIGAEDISKATRHSHLVAYSATGQSMWDIPLTENEGSYLYTRGIHENSPLIMVGTDDGRLQAYKLETPMLSARK